MVQRSSIRQEALLKEFGMHVKRWRKVNGVTATALARQAMITRESLRNLESGSGAVRLDTVFAVLTRLRIVDRVIEAADPYRNEVARPRIDAIIGAGGVV